MPNDDYIKRDDVKTAVFAWYVDAMLHGEKKYLDEVIAKIPAANVEPKRRWIQVTEKPPEAGVIVWDGDHTPFTADEIVAKEYDGETMYFAPKYMVSFPIIAWMSPPEPPGEVDDGHMDV